MVLALSSLYEYQNQKIKNGRSNSEEKIFNPKIIDYRWHFATCRSYNLCDFSKVGRSKLNIEKERISISTVKNDVFQENIPVNGIVLPITTIYLDALEGGRVEEKFVEDGIIVKKGDPILRLSNTDLELSLINQETSVYNLLTQMQISQNAARQNTINRQNQFTDVENNLIEAKRVYDLNSRLYEKGAIGRQDYESSQNLYEYQKNRMDLAEQVLAEDSVATKLEVNQAQNSYARTQSALELMRKKVGDLVVKAPVDGQLTSRDAEIGQSKNKGERLGQVDVLSGFKVRVDIDEHYISRIYNGQKGTFKFNDTTYVLAIKKYLPKSPTEDFKWICNLRATCQRALDVAEFTDTGSA